MARILIPCIDSEGYLVTFESSDHEMKELIESYPHIQGFLQESGFTQTKTGSGKTYGSRGPRKPVIYIDGKSCPKCNGGVWDNREKIRTGEFGPKSPDFSCKNKDCGWAIWKGQYTFSKEDSQTPLPGEETEHADF